MIIVSAPVQRSGFWIFPTWSDLGTCCYGDWDLDLGLTIVKYLVPRPRPTNLYLTELDTVVPWVKFFFITTHQDKLLFTFKPTLLKEQT